MKMIFRMIGVLWLCVALVGCKQRADNDAAIAAAQISEDSTGYFCHMFLSEHYGPKAHLFLASQDEPIWFTEVNQLFAFNMLPEEPKDIVTMYVSDATHIHDWKDPASNEKWLNAKEAFYVIESAFVGGMGSDDALPFKERDDAEAYVSEHGGKVVSYDEMPRSFVFQQPLQSQPTDDHGHEHGSSSQEHHQH